MNYTQQLLLSLIRYEIEGIKVEEELLSLLDEEALLELYKLSAEQDVTYIVADALSKLGVLSGDAKEVFFNEQLSAIYRTQLFAHELEKISDIFEKNSISHIPLKGAVIRDLYPKPEMRQSCDTDILIHREDMEKAGKLLTEELGYSYKYKSGHDATYKSDNGHSLELHFRLFENKSNQKDVLDEVWQNSIICDGYAYKYKMNWEFFIVYHVFHMSKHIINGGCGIRPFLDLWILENRITFDREKLNILLKRAGLKKLFDVAEIAASAWCSGGKEDVTSRLLKEYVFSAGIFGTLENAVAVSVAKKGGKLRDLISRVFLPRELLKNQNPILEDKPWLTPYYEVKRWHRIIFKSKDKVQMKIAKHNLNLTDEKRQKAEKLVKELGLK